MKVIDILRTAAKPFASFELVPPLKGSDVARLYESLDPLMAFKPPFINITCHRDEVEYVPNADGTFTKMTLAKRPGTVAIVAAIMRRYPQIEIVPHVICGGASRSKIESELLDLHFLGIQNVLALRGDAMPGTSRFVAERDGHAHAEQLVEQIINMNNGKFIDGEPDTSHNTDFCIGVAGYPEKHVESPNYLTDMGYLKQKVDAGAEYIATQICYDADKIIAFRDKCAEININVPILPGLKPFASKTQLTVLPQTFAVDLPQELVDRVVRCKNNDDVKQVGIEWAIQMGEKLQKAGFPVLHFYTMTRTEQVQQIVKALM